MESFARTSIARAENVILHSQLEWAADAAQRGDYFAARNHCVFALAKRPEWMDRFAQALSPLGMRYFFEDVRAPMREDPKFCNRILLLTPITAKPLDWVTEVMNSFHPLAKESALWMLSAAALENRKGDAQSNLRWQCEIMHRWPQDPAAFANAADILSRHERWEAAHYVISQTPDSFHHLRMAPTVLRWIEAQDTDAARKPGSKERFFGQPDIGGLVQGPSFWRDIFANLPGFQLLP